MDIIAKKIMILGEGISGKGAFEALKNIAYPFFYREGESFIKPDLVVISPGISSHYIIEYAFKNEIPIISEIELGYILNSNKRIVAVTGTNGKTTVTRLIGEILNKKYMTEIAGNIGKSFCLLNSSDYEVAVLEVSSFQLERCFGFTPHIAVITNITPDHLDRHKTMENYIKTKLRIIKNQTREDFLICPYDLSLYLNEKINSKIIFSDIDCKIIDDCIYLFDEYIMSLKGVKLIGEHNRKNIMQAVIVSKLLSLKNEQIQEAVINFVPDKHRLQRVSTKNNINWYDDSKATNIDSCLSACLSMEGETALILGGSDKGYDYDELFISLPKNIVKIFVLGEVKEKLILSSSRALINVTETENLYEAVLLSSKENVKNVLLSPASASFDHFKDYKDRGEKFLQYIESL